MRLNFASITIQHFFCFFVANVEWSWSRWPSPPSPLSTPLSMPEKFRTSLHIIARISFSDACAMNETLNCSFVIDTTYPWVPEGFFSKAQERHESRGQSGALRFAWRSFGLWKKIPLAPRVYNTHSKPMVFHGSFFAPRNVYCSERERFRRGSKMISRNQSRASASVASARE